MKNLKKKPAQLIAVVVVAIVAVLAAGFILLVKPKQDEGAQLADEIANLETEINVVEAQLRQPPPAETEPLIKVADLFRLAKAMPDSDDMAGIMLEISSVAKSAGVRFLAIEPQASPIAGASYHGQPIKLTFDGSYFDLHDFLLRLRTLVTVRDGELDADGRMYTLDSFDLHESQKGFPEVEAILTVTAFSYGALDAGVPGAPVAPVAAPASTETTDTTATTSTDESTDQAALGAGEDGS